MSGWVRFENTMPENLKVAPVSDRAFRLWIHAVCYCSRAQTDGFVPGQMATRLSSGATKRTVGELIHYGLFEEVQDGYIVHDYLDHNPSRARISQLKESARERTQRWRDGSGDSDVTRHETGNQGVTSHTRDRSVYVPTPSCSTDEGQQKTGRAPTKHADPNVLPASLVSDLHDTARAALGRLAAVQLERGGDVPTLRGVGLAVARFPDRDHLSVLAELEHWALAGNGQRRPVKDWSRTYATFLERSPAGKPTVVTTGQVLPIRRPDNADSLLRKIHGGDIA